MATMEEYVEAVKAEIQRFDSDVDLVEDVVRKVADYFEGCGYAIADLAGDDETSHVFFAYDILLFTRD